MIKNKLDSLKELVEHQIQNLYPSQHKLQLALQTHIKSVNQTVNCISSIKAWRTQGFDYLISWQYATYLYFLSRNTFYDDQNKELATKLFLLNKSLNSFELFYEIELPPYFFLSHTIGIVFGKAAYDNYCVFHQGCTIGRNGEDRPTLEDGVIMFPNSSIIGNCHVKSNTVLAPSVQLINQNTPGNCYVFPGENGKVLFKEINEYYPRRYFDI